VLLGVMKADPEHYLNVDPGWTPIVAGLPGTGERHRIDRLRKFLAFATQRQFL
jgi:hypothetical protein